MQSIYQSVDFAERINYNYELLVSFSMQKSSRRKAHVLHFLP